MALDADDVVRHDRESTSGIVDSAYQLRVRAECALCI